MQVLDRKQDYFCPMRHPPQVLMKKFLLFGERGNLQEVFFIYLFIFVFSSNQSIYIINIKFCVSSTTTIPLSTIIYTHFFPSLYVYQHSVKIGAQSFTSLKADLRQAINRGSLLSRCLNGTFP